MINMIPITRQERYMRQDISTGLGGLAADLVRIVSASRIPAPHAVHDLIAQSRAFSEWCARDLVPTRVDDAALLLQIQRSLTGWYHNWQDAKEDPAQREQLARQAQEWSDQVLEMSGLLE